jgi:branched-subunit amino acid aminotransferase/4-amino-4-deoxychorismate lyase
VVTIRVLKPQGLTMSSYVMINGQITDEVQARIPALDRGFLYGDCIYEILAVRNGVLLDIERHLTRLRASAIHHGIMIPWSDDLLRFDMEHLVTSHPYEYGEMRLVVSRGLGGAPIPTPDLKPQRYLYYRETSLPLYEEGSPGVKLMIRVSPVSQNGYVAKTNNYLNAISACAEAEREGFDEVLWTGIDGAFTECAFANIFFICREGDLVEIATPPVTAGLLEGITRSRIIDLLTMAKIPVTERTITADELPRFDEAFVTSSVKTLRPVTLIDRHRLHSTRRNAVFWHIRRLYNSWTQTQVLDRLQKGEKH